MDCAIITCHLTFITRHYHSPPNTYFPPLHPRCFPWLSSGRSLASFYRRNNLPIGQIPGMENMEKYFALLKRQKEQLQKAKAFKGQKPMEAVKRSRKQLESEFTNMVSHPPKIRFL